MAVAWTLSINGGTAVSAESLGLVVASEFRASQQTDTISLRVADDTADAGAMEWLDKVVIYRNGSRYFSGTVTSVPRGGDGGAESSDVILSGPWWWLEQCTPRTATLRPDGSGETMLRAVRNFPGSTNVGVHVDAVLDDAVTFGVPMVVGTVDACFATVDQSVVGGTFADQLRALLAWIKDVVVWFDYTTTPNPTIHVRRSSSLSVQSLTRGTDLVSVEAVTRNDLIPDRVMVLYAGADAEGVVNYIERLAGTAPSGRPSRDLVVTACEPAKSNPTYEEGTVETTDVPAQSAVTLAAKEWYAKRVPAIADLVERGFDPADIFLSNTDVDSYPNFARRHRVAYQVGAFRVGDNADPLVDFPRELIGGQVEVWMRKKARNCLATATLAISAGNLASYASDEPLHAALLEVFSKVQTYGSTDYHVAQAAVNFVATDASTGTPRRLVSSERTDVYVHPALANNILTMMSTAPVEGTASGYDNEPGARTWMGKRLRVMGDNAAWESMDSVVQSVSGDLEAGTFALTFGPANQIDFQRLVDQAIKPYTRTATYPAPSGANYDAASPNTNGQLVSAAPEDKPDHPWRVKIRETSTAGVYEVGVIAGSVLQNGAVPGDLIAVTGLLSEDLSAGWLLAEEEDHVWLEVDFTGETVAAAVKTVAEGGLFDLDADAWAADSIVEDDGEDPPVHATSRKLIAKVSGGDVNQRVSTHLELNVRAIGGRAARYPY